MGADLRLTCAWVRLELPNLPDEHKMRGLGVSAPVSDCTFPTHHPREVVVQLGILESYT